MSTTSLASIPDDEIWQLWNRERSQDIKDELVLRYLPLVEQTAGRMRIGLPRSVQLDELVNAGMIGLISAVDNFEIERGFRFETYASIRIRGSMLDEIRKNDWAPRSVHRNARRVAEAVRHIENDKGRDARDNEIAELLEMDLDEYYQFLQDTAPQIF